LLLILVERVSADADHDDRDEDDSDNQSNVSLGRGCGWYDGLAGGTVLGIGLPH